MSLGVHNMVFGPTFLTCKAVACTHEMNNPLFQCSMISIPFWCDKVFIVLLSVSVLLAISKKSSCKLMLTGSRDFNIQLDMMTDQKTVHCCLPHNRPPIFATNFQV